MNEEVKLKRTRRRYDEAFRREAVALVESSGRPLGEIATQLGITHWNLRDWIPIYGKRSTARQLEARVQRRARAFGAASVLFYEKPLEFVRGEGCRLYDASGVAYLDAYNNVPSVGHAHPRVVEATSRQVSRLNIHNRYLHEGVVEYAERILATFPAALGNITFTCTGSESNDLALRMAACTTGARGAAVAGICRARAGGHRRSATLWRGVFCAARG